VRVYGIGFPRSTVIFTSPPNINFNDILQYKTDFFITVVSLSVFNEINIKGVLFRPDFCANGNKISSFFSRKKGERKNSIPK
jgi:hypothetical protein